MAIRKLGLADWKQAFVIWVCLNELFTCVLMQQFNIAIAGMILFSFIFIERKQEFWAALMIVLGTMTKIYGIVGLAFLLFSKRRIAFLKGLIFWGIVLYVLPMLYTSPQYVASQYVKWYEVLLDKNVENLFTPYTNISLLGMVRKISGSVSYSDMYLIIGGLLLFGLPYLRISQYKYEAFRKTLLASVLMFVVLFSTGSESSTYIIAFIGVAIWYTAVPWKRSTLDIVLMVFAFILTSMSPSDLFPKYIRVHYVYPYALKALPCMLIWLKLTFEMCTRSYNPVKA